MKDKTSVEQIVENIVRNDVFYNVSYLISELGTNDQYFEEIMEFSLKYPDNEEEIQELGDQKDDLEDYFDDLLQEIDEYIDDTPMTYDQAGALKDLFEGIKDDTLSEIDQEIDDLKAEQEEPEEAYEFWIVSDWLADKLSDRGELVTKDFLGLTIWGRTCTGQSITMDWVIQDIAKEVYNYKV